MGNERATLSLVVYMYYVNAS